MRWWVHSIERSLDNRLILNLAPTCYGMNRKLESWRENPKKITRKGIKIEDRKILKNFMYDGKTFDSISLNMIIVHGILLFQEPDEKNQLKILYTKRPKKTGYYRECISFSFEEQMDRKFKYDNKPEFHPNHTSIHYTTPEDKKFHECFRRGVEEELGIDREHLEPNKVHVLALGREFSNLNFGCIACYKLKDFYFHNKNLRDKSIKHLYLRNKKRRIKRGFESLEKVCKVIAFKSNNIDYKPFEIHLVNINKYINKLEEALKQDLNDVKLSEQIRENLKQVNDSLNETRMLVRKYLTKDIMTTPEFKSIISEYQIPPDLLKEIDDHKQRSIIHIITVKDFEDTEEDIPEEIGYENFNEENLKKLMHNYFNNIHQLHPTSRSRIILTALFYYGHEKILNILKQIFSSD
jgi:hypothetical protein